MKTFILIAQKPGNCVNREGYYQNVQAEHEPNVDQFVVGCFRQVLRVATFVQ